MAGKSPDNLTKFEKNFLEFMLKITKALTMAAFSNQRSNEINDLLSLVKKNSSVKYEEEKKIELEK